MRHDGDVNARVWIRIREVEQSLALIDQMLDRLPSGELRVPVDGDPAGRCEGHRLRRRLPRRRSCLAFASTAMAASMRCHLRDPSWFQWPLLEAAIEGNIVADFPLCNKSFNCSYSGHDL